MQDRRIPRPDDWHMAWDDAHSSYYYYKPATGERRWERDFKLLGNASGMNASFVSGGACSSTALPEQEQSKKPLEVRLDDIILEEAQMDCLERAYFGESKVSKAPIDQKLRVEDGECIWDREHGNPVLFSKAQRSPSRSDYSSQTTAGRQSTCDRSPQESNDSYICIGAKDSLASKSNDSDILNPEHGEVRLEVNNDNGMQSLGSIQTSTGVSVPRLSLRRCSREGEGGDTDQNCHKDDSTSSFAQSRGASVCKSSQEETCSSRATVPIENKIKWFNEDPDKRQEKTPSSRATVPIEKRVQSFINEAPEKRPLSSEMDEMQKPSGNEDDVASPSSPAVRLSKKGDLPPSPQFGSADDESDAPRVGPGKVSSGAVSSSAAPSADPSLQIPAVASAVEEPEVLPPTPPGKGSGKGKDAEATKGKSKGKTKGKAKGKDAVPGASLKNDVIPKTKMKKVFWKPLCLNESERKSLDGQEEATVWEKIHQAGASFDEEELELLFADNPARVGNRPRAATAPLPVQSSATENSTVRQGFSESRRRQIWVMLASMPEWRRLPELIAEMDDTKLTPENLEVLVSCLPSFEEELTLKSWSKESPLLGHETWDVPEDFMIMLINIPSYRLRIQAWSFLKSFDSSYSCLWNSKANMMDAFDTLRNSSRIERLLAVSLHVGNYLNGGTTRGCADGFDIDTLPKLVTLKAQDPKGVTGVADNLNLLDYIVKQIEQQTPGVLAGIFDEGMEKQRLHAVRKDKLSDLTTEVASHKAEIHGLSNSWRAAKFVDTISAAVEEKLSQKASQVQKLEEDLKKLEAKYSQVCSWFQMDGEQTKSTDEFFSIWDDFLDNVRKSLDKTRPSAKSQPIQLKKKRSSSVSTEKRNSGSSPGRSRSIRLDSDGSGRNRRPTTPRTHVERPAAAFFASQMQGTEKQQADGPQRESSPKETQDSTLDVRTESKSQFAIAARIVEDSFKKAELLRKAKEAGAELEDEGQLDENEEYDEEETKLELPVNVQNQRKVICVDETLNAPEGANARVGIEEQRTQAEDHGVEEKPRFGEDALPWLSQTDKCINMFLQNSQTQFQGCLAEEIAREPENQKSAVHLAA